MIPFLCSYNIFGLHYYHFKKKLDPCYHYLIRSICFSIYKLFRFSLPIFHTFCFYSKLLTPLWGTNIYPKVKVWTMFSQIIRILAILYYISRHFCFRFFSQYTCMPIQKLCGRGIVREHIRNRNFVTTVSEPIIMYIVVVLEKIKTFFSQCRPLGFHSI